MIDGVVASADTLQAMHFSEVAKYFTPIRFSRGAYPARVISEKAWRRLPRDLQTILIQSKPVWEKSLETELTKAQQGGLDYGLKHGVEFVVFANGEQEKFDVLYYRFAAKQARDLNHLKIPGEPVFAETQRLIASAQGGQVNCRR